MAEPPEPPTIPHGTTEPAEPERADRGGPRAVKVRCPRCGAELTWDPDTDALACAYCGHGLQVPRGEGTIVERTLEEAGGAARGFGVATLAARCTSCGATTDFTDRDVAAQCAFCGAPAVLEESSYRNALRPESLIPLDVGRAQIEAAFRRWTAGLWFRPGELKRARIDGARGVYVPAWTFDCDVHSAWSADAGWYYTVMEPRPVVVNGKVSVRMVPVQKVRWEPAFGQRRDAYDDLLVHASRGLPQALAAELGRYDTGALVPYRPEYLAGWGAEEYAVDLESAWAAGLKRVEETQRARCSGDVPGDTQRDLRVRNTVSDVRWKLVLLPVWSLTYRHGGRTFAVLVHGQSGRVVGDAPYSWAKIALLVLAIAAAVLVALALLAL